MSLKTVQSQIHHFLERVWERKPWVLTTTVLLAALAYVGHFTLSIPEQYGKQARNSVTFDESIAEGERIALIFDIVKGATAKYKASLDHYSGNVANKEWPEPTDPQIIERGFEVSTTAVKTLSLSRGALKGIQLRDEILNNCRQQFDESFAELEAVQETLIKLYVAYSLKDEESANKLTPDLRQAQATSDHIAIRIAAATQSFGEQASSLSEAERVEIGIAIAEVKLLNLQAWLVLLALLYSAGYAIAVLVAVFKLPAEPAAESDANDAIEANETAK